eukprot:1555789-Prorocentrum_lima.AAC.1
MPSRPALHICSDTGCWLAWAAVAHGDQVIESYPAARPLAPGLEWLESSSLAVWCLAGHAGE